MSELLEAARAYAQRGWAVFPLSPRSKDPLPRSHGFKDATCDEAKIRATWSRHPQANIGVPTGALSGLVVLDVDVKNDKDGEATLRDLLNGHDALPATLEQRTPSGGRHLIFRAPDGYKVSNSAGKLGPGLDVRGDGGYIVVAPSSTKEGAYEWTNNVPPAPAPDWLFAKQTRIPAGQRNAGLTSVAGKLRARGLGAEAIEVALRAANEQRCDPPLAESEVVGIAQGIASRYRRGHPCTDLGNAERLADTFSERLKYCPQLSRWLLWDGIRWHFDEDGAAPMRCAKAIARAILAEAQAEPDDSRRTTLARWAAASESAGRLSAAVELARSDPKLRVNSVLLDANPWLLGLQDGVLDLKTGAHVPASPDHFITKQACASFDPEVHAPLWEKFLARIFADDSALIRYVQRVVGYSLSGNTGEKALFFLYGPGGDNGKSTLVETLMALLGDYAVKTRAETFMRSQRGDDGGATPGRVALRGARLVVASELSDRQQFDETFLKDVTGGDRITARALYAQPLTFRPEFKLMLYGNHKPRLREDDAAAWRRLHMVPFEVRIPLAEQDPSLGEKLLSELPGILNWALAGLAEWREHRLAPPEKVLAASAEYREEMDTIGRFLAERCEQKQGLEIKSSELYRAYRNWIEGEGQHPMANATFSMKLAERGIEWRTLEGVRLWRGIALRF